MQVTIGRGGVLRVVFIGYKRQIQRVTMLEIWSINEFMLTPAYVFLDGRIIGNCLKGGSFRMSLPSAKMRIDDIRRGGDRHEVIEAKPLVGHRQSQNPAGLQDAPAS